MPPRHANLPYPKGKRTHRLRQFHPSGWVSPTLRYASKITYGNSDNKAAIKKTLLPLLLRLNIKQLHQLAAIAALFWIFFLLIDS